MHDALVQKRRNNQAALKLLRRLPRYTGIHPEAIMTDKLTFYRTAMKALNLKDLHNRDGMRDNIGRRARTS